ncbi:MAG: GntR family transcriptional regulator, partial [Lacticaseibacillus paracasei]
HLDRDALHTMIDELYDDLKE